LVVLSVLPEDYLNSLTSGLRTLPKLKTLAKYSTNQFLLPVVGVFNRSDIQHTLIVKR